MKALEARKQVQGILAVTQDGDIGQKTISALNRLAGTDAESEWPPVAAAPSQGGGFSGLDDNLRAEYQRLWDTMVYRWEDDHADEPGLEAIYQGLKVEFRGVIASIKANRGRYEAIASAAGGSIPWDFIAIIHNLECGLNFNKHLHNGDPLTRRTVLVPADRPAAGNPPFTFEESAADALTMPGKRYHLETDWTLPATLFRLEGYNGLGYLKFHPSVKSPYLWSGSNHYTRGKYVADGVWSSSAVSKQLGTALLLKELRKA